ncbi:MAG: Hsp20/alpha crystallin family protein [Pseudomonadota bacterium]|nr:Hsp20/alpha crystallin family protein [Pseudomonadota bacterium]
MAIATLNPWQVLDQLSNDNLRRYGQRRWQPVVDISESKNGYEIHLELPGIKPEQVQVELDEKVLKISGEKARTEEEGTEYRYRERAVGEFSRSFTLPEDADRNAIHARFEHGLLVVEISKKAQVQPRRIEIQTQ